MTEPRSQDDRDVWEFNRGHDGEFAHSPLVCSLPTDAMLQHSIDTTSMPLIVPEYFKLLTSRDPGKAARFAGETVEQLEGPRFATALRTAAHLLGGHSEKHDDDDVTIRDWYVVTEILAAGASLFDIVAEYAFAPQGEYDELRDDDEAFPGT